MVQCHQSLMDQDTTDSIYCIPLSIDWLFQVIFTVICSFVYLFAVYTYRNMHISASIILPFCGTATFSKKYRNYIVPLFLTYEAMLRISSKEVKILNIQNVGGNQERIDQERAICWFIIATSRIIRRLFCDPTLPLSFTCLG